MFLYQYRGVLGGGYLLAWLSPWLVYFAAGVAMAHVRPLVVKPFGLLVAAVLGALAFAGHMPLLWASFGVVSVLVFRYWFDSHNQGLIRSTLIYLGQLIKRHFEFVKVRYRGLKQNTIQFFTLFVMSNFWMVRS